MIIYVIIFLKGFSSENLYVKYRSVTSLSKKGQISFGINIILAYIPISLRISLIPFPSGITQVIKS